MYIIHVKNLITNDEYEAKFATVEDCEYWHGIRLSTHGNEHANPPTAEVTIRHDAEEQIAKLWSDANAYAEQSMDQNSRTSISLMLASNTATPQQLSRINDFGAWWQSLWSYYAGQKAKILAGEDASFDPAAVGECPWTIWQIAE